MAAERDSLTQDYLDTVRVDDPLEPAPPEGVFQALKNAGGNNVDDDDGDDDDDDVDDERDERIRQRARDLLDGGGEGGGGDDNDEELAHTGVDGTPDDALTPRFSKSGKFVGYESRTPIEDRGVADIMFNGSPQDVKDAFRRNKRCRGLLAGFSIFFFALAIGLTFFMVGDLIGMAIEKDLPGQSLAGADSAVAEGEKKHTHPKMNHTKPPSASSPSHSSPAADPTSIIPAQSPASTPSQASPYDPMASQYAQTYPPTGGGTPTEEISRVVKVEPAALATIKRAEPDDRFDGIEELGVENNERVSFVRFDLSQHPGTNASHDVVYATLLLYLKSHDGVDEGGTTLLVELLPNAGAWVEDTVSWNDPPDATGAVAVATHRWAGESFEELHPIELNVKAAIMNVAVNATGEATFRLSTESGGFLFFEGRKWNSGVGVPELAISYN